MLRHRPLAAACALVLAGLALSATTLTTSGPAAATPATPATHAQHHRPVPGSAAQRSNVPGLSSRRYVTSFVTRHGSQLRVAGRPFRFTGANVEYLGLENYGPNPSKTVPAGSERYPTKYEIDDALATAHEMGATAIRVQSLGDTIGCRLCLEPTLGHFNPSAFRHLDLLVAEARRYGIKLWGEFDGDANGSAPAGQTNFQSHSWYCAWEHADTHCGLSFFTDPKILADYERHMKAVLDHVNPLTGLAYKDDPTIMGWGDGNNLDLLDGVPPNLVESWLRKVSDYYHSLDPRQLFMNISLTGGDLTLTPSVLRIPHVDVYGMEYYPHWFPVAQGGIRINGAAPLLHANAAQTAAAGKAFSIIEWGWDNTNFLTQRALGQFVHGLDADRHVVGDGFWALEGHQRGHGWLPVPANGGCVPTCEELEDGNWWALYYTGLPTLSNQAADMAARAQILRQSSYRIDGFTRTPRHERVPAPVITRVAGRTVTFEGSAGAARYAVYAQSRGHASLLCSHCAGTALGRFVDPRRTGSRCYRVRGYGLDGRAGPLSRPAGRCGHAR